MLIIILIAIFILILLYIINEYNNIDIYTDTDTDTDTEHFSMKKKKTPIVPVPIDSTKKMSTSSTLSDINKKLMIFKEESKILAEQNQSLLNGQINTVQTNLQTQINSMKNNMDVASNMVVGGNLHTKSIDVDNIGNIVGDVHIGGNTFYKGVHIQGPLDNLKAADGNDIGLPLTATDSYNCANKCISTYPAYLLPPAPGTNTAPTAQASMYQLSNNNCYCKSSRAIQGMDNDYKTAIIYQ